MYDQAQSFQCISEKSGFEFVEFEFEFGEIFQVRNVQNKKIEIKQNGVFLSHKTETATDRVDWSKTKASRR